MSSSANADPIVQSAARWFWWIAGLSLVNTVLAHAGANVNFVVGLGMTAVIDAVFKEQVPLAIALAALPMAFYFVIGLMAQRGKLWAFYVGLAVYALDALIYVKFEDWMPVAFHALAAFYIFKGIARLRSPAAPAAA